PFLMPISPWRWCRGDSCGSKEPSRDASPVSTRCASTRSWRWRSERRSRSPTRTIVTGPRPLSTSGPAARPCCSSPISGSWLSSYIKVFVIGLALSVIVSTLVDFQFKYFIQRLYPDPHRLAEFLGIFYVVLNSLALLFQFGAAGWLLQRIGLGASTGLQPTTV